MHFFSHHFYILNSPLTPFTLKGITHIIRHSKQLEPNMIVHENS